MAIINILAIVFFDFMMSQFCSQYAQSYNEPSWHRTGRTSVPMSSTGYLGLAISGLDGGTLAAAFFDNITLISNCSNVMEWEFSGFRRLPNNNP